MHPQKLAPLAALAVLLLVPAPASAALKFFRPDGSRISVPNRVTVACTTPAGFPPQLEVFGGLGSATNARGAFWRIFGARSAIRSGRGFGFPSGNTGLRRLTFSITSPRSGGGEHFGVSVDRGSRGRIVIHEAGCAPRPHIAFSIYARLASDTNRGRILVYGSVRAGQSRR